MGNQIARTAHRTTVRKDIPPAERNDRWLTPLPIIERIGPFDLDPAGAPGHPTAKTVYTLEGGADGLTDPWFGRVWLNPPYGREMRKWVDRMIDHHLLGGTGTILIPVAMGTKLWQDAVGPFATAIHFWRHRINFHSRDGSENGMVSVQASAIVAFGDYDADRLAQSDFPGLFLDFRG